MSETFHEIAGGKSSRKIVSFFVRNILENTDEDEDAVDWVAHEVDVDAVAKFGLQLVFPFDGIIVADVEDVVDDEVVDVLVDDDDADEDEDEEQTVVDDVTIEVESSVMHLIKSSAEIGVILADVVRGERMSTS